MRTSLPWCGHASCTAEALGGSMRICWLPPLSPTRLSGQRTSIWPGWPANSESHTGLAPPDERPWPSSDGALFVSFRYRRISTTTTFIVRPCDTILGMLVRSASRRIKMQMRPWAVLISLALGVLRAQSGPIVPSSMPYTVSTSALLPRGFSFDKTPRKMWPISGPDGPCQIEAFIGGEKTEDPERYTCRKLDRATYVGRCINGKLEGLSVVLAEGSAKDGAEWVLTYFDKGRVAFPALMAYR